MCPGDMMFTDDSIEEKEIDGEAHLTFTPTSLSCVSKDSDIGNKIGRAKIGIVFILHTQAKH